MSTIYRRPDYQSDLPGIQATRPGQLIQLGGMPRVLASEPAGFAGRNLPDLSANADTNSGYLHVVHGRVLGHRTGQLNPLLYRLARHGTALTRDIAAGDNWGYLTHAAYDQTTGLGAMDAAKLLAGLRSFDGTRGAPP